MPLVRPAHIPDLDTELKLFCEEHNPETTGMDLQRVLKFIAGGGEGRWENVKRLALVGYCYGGRYVVRMLAGFDGASGYPQLRIDVGAIYHPSFFTIDEIRALVVYSQKERGKATRALAIFSAETDEIFPESKRRETEDVLKRGGAVEYISVLYSGTEHGFASRGDLSNPVVKYAREGSLEEGVRWLRSHWARKS